jgi:O-antigen ligase
VVRVEKIFGFLLDAGIIFLIVFTPLAFGAVHIWAYSLLEIVVYSLLILWAAKSFFSSELKFDRTLVPLYITFILFIAYSYLQTVPVSPDTVKTLSPKAYELYGMVIPGYAGADVARSLSVYPHATKVSLLKFIAYFGVFFLITQEIREKKRLKRLILAIVAVGSFEALYGLYGYFSNDPYIFGFKNIYFKESATGTFVNRNHFAGYLGITVFTTLGYLFSRVHGAAKGAYYSFGQKVYDFLNTARATKGALLLIAIVTMALGIAFSLSRMGVFSLVATSLLIFIVTARGMEARHSKVLFIIVSVGLIAVLWYGLDPLEERYYRSSDDLFKSRLVVWKATGSLIEDYPLTGTGLGTYRHVFQRYKPADFTGSLAIYEHAHNDYLEMLSESGIAGTAIIMIGAIYFLTVFLKKLLKNTDPNARGIALGVLGSVIYISLHSLTDFNMHIPSNALALFIVMAIAYCSVIIRRKRKDNAVN